MEGTGAMSDSVEVSYAALQSMLEALSNERLELVARVEALELAANSADASLVEALRQDRWWATYNAALKAMIIEAEPTRQQREIVHETCASHADRAHGPLVRPLVAEAGIAVDPKVWAQGGRFMYTVDAQAHNALIQAASAATDAYNATLSPTPICQAAIDALEAALKPFEP
jgi:hypothetical protein